MVRFKTSHSNFKLIIGLFALTLLFAYFNYHGSREHFLSSFSRALLITTFSFYFIQISQERQNTISSKELNAKQRRIVLIASLFTMIQIIMTRVFNSLLYHEEINWFKTITIGFAMAILFFIVTSIHYRYNLKSDKI